MISILLPLPEIIEQRAISTALSDVDALLAKLDALIAKKRDLKQAAMQQLLTAQTRLPGFSEPLPPGKLGDLFMSKPQKKNLPSDTEISFLGMEDVSESGRILRETPLLVKNVKSGLTWFERGDVLVAKITPCFENGKGAQLDNLKNVVGVGSTEFHILRAKPLVASSRYIFFHTQSDAFRRKLELEMVGSAGQKRVPMKGIQEYELPAMHSFDEQTAIATVLSDMDAEITALEARRDKTHTLKQGMMQELLTGQIRLV